MAPKMIREVSAALGFTPGSTICATGRNCLDGRHKKSCARKIKHAYRSGRTFGQRAPRGVPPRQKLEIAPGYQGLTVDGRDRRASPLRSRPCWWWSTTKALAPIGMQLGVTANAQHHRVERRSI